MLRFGRSCRHGGLSDPSLRYRRPYQVGGVVENKPGDRYFLAQAMVLSILVVACRGGGSEYDYLDGRMVYDLGKEEKAALLRVRTCLPFKCRFRGECKIGECKWKI